MYPIFISYRRSDLSLEAEWLYNVISTFFGQDIVFFDKEEIESGKRWDDTLHTCISSAYMVLILIGPKWLKEQLESGRRRLDDPEDWVRKEVIAAIAAYKNNPEQRWIFSVLLNGTPLPKQEYLPEELQELSSFQIEKKLQFSINNYLEVAGDLYILINEQLSKIRELGLIKEINAIPFDPGKVPNPYDLPEYQLPEELRLWRPDVPFKGLEYFTREDARIFFGRTKEIGELLDYFKKSQNIIRLYGQSGVGKSSLLSAGLQPRLEAKGWNIQYYRRDIKVSPNKYLSTFSCQQQNPPFQDSLLILDQLDEMIINPKKEENELDNLSMEIQKLMKTNVNRGNKPIRLMLCYRKEYDVEIRTALRKNLIDSNEYWLKDLSEPGMREAITGITKDSDLIDKYHLQIEEGLDNIIINELLDNDTKENSTPLLQMLLRKMWDRVNERDIENHIFTKEIYEECKSKDLQELLQEQLQAIINREIGLQEAVTSGLGLDVLKCFVTEADTSTEQGEEEITSRYNDEQLVKGLLQALVDVYLLVRSENKIYRISHDTLAKAVRIQYSNSQLAGQHAARLLDSKWQDIEADGDVEFSKPDLAIIEAGKIGMRKLTEKEVKVIEESRQRIQQYEKKLDEKKTNKLNYHSKRQEQKR